MVARGGGSDGNFTGALGIPTLDSLGVRGTGIHTLEERMAIGSLEERARDVRPALLTMLAREGDGRIEGEPAS